MREFHALGALTITDNGDLVSIGGPRQRRLVAMLLIHCNTTVSVDRLSDVVFDGEPTQAASATLCSYLSRVRKVVNGSALGPTLMTQAPHRAPLHLGLGAGGGGAQDRHPGAPRGLRPDR